MNKNVNKNIADLLTSLNDYEKLQVYEFLLNLHSIRRIYQVNYKAKRPESQAKTSKSRKFVRVVKIQ